MTQQPATPFMARTLRPAGTGLLDRTPDNTELKSARNAGTRRFFVAGAVSGPRSGTTTCPAVRRGRQPR